MSEEQKVNIKLDVLEQFIKNFQLMTAENVENAFTFNYIEQPGKTPENFCPLLRKFLDELDSYVTVTHGVEIDPKTIDVIVDYVTVTGSSSLAIVNAQAVIECALDTRYETPMLITELIFQCRKFNGRHSYQVMIRTLTTFSDNDSKSIMLNSVGFVLAHF